MYSHWYTILHLLAKFCSNRMIVGGVMTSYPFFSRWRPAATLDLIWVMLDHPRSAIVSISSVLKFGLDPIYSFGDIVISIFCRFGLKLPIHSHFWGREGVGGIFPPNIQIWSPIVLTPKRTILWRKHVVWAIWGEAPSAPIEMKICMVGHLAHVIMYAKFQRWYFQGLRFYRGRLSHFPTDQIYI